MIAVVFAMAVVAQVLISDRRRSPSPSTAQAITAGMSRFHAPGPAEPEDETLSDNVAAAGAMWAERHRPLNADECPNYTADFRKGCADYVTGAAR
ncbi:MAG: hypothetical protein ABI906_06985 [Pseudomonadota bacterium]